jgi:hypothetical protein
MSARNVQMGLQFPIGLLDFVIRSKETESVTNPTPIAFPICTICRKPVNLETSKTDDVGQAIHEECYVRMVRKKSPTPWES